MSPGLAETKTHWKRFSWYCLLASLRWKHLHFMVKSPPPWAILRSYRALFVSLSQRITSPLTSSLLLPSVHVLPSQCFHCDISLAPKQPCDTFWPFSPSLLLHHPLPCPADFAALSHLLLCAEAPGLNIFLFHCWTAKHSDLSEYNWKAQKPESVTDWRALKKGDLSAWVWSCCLPVHTPHWMRWLSRH